MLNLLLYTVIGIFFALGSYMLSTKGEIKKIGGIVLLIIAAVFAVANFAGELTRNQPTMPGAVLAIIAAVIVFFSFPKLEKWLAQPLGDIKSSSN